MSDENAQVFETVQDAVPESDAPESTGAELDESGLPLEGEESGEQGEEFADGELEAKAKAQGQGQVAKIRALAR